MEFALNRKTIAKSMLSIIAVLLVMHVTQLVVYFYIGNPDEFDFIHLLDFDYEGNLPSLYSSLAIFFSAILLWIIARHASRNGMAFARHWIGLAVIFTFLGVDEATALHEELGDIVEASEIFEATGFLYFAWVVPYGLLLIAFCLSYLKFVLQLPNLYKIQFVVAGMLFVAGAVGLETISAKEADLHGAETIYYSFLYTLEELCEMIAIVIFSHALLHYIEHELEDITFKVTH